jgi:hypothetical protein
MQNDVLIYNFFHDSPAKRAWRALVSWLNSRQTTTSTEEVNAIDSSEARWRDKSQDSFVSVRQPNFKSGHPWPTDSSTVPDSLRCRMLDFDPVEHKILEAELKQLYVVSAFSPCQSELFLWLVQVCGTHTGEAQPLLV